MTRDPGTDDNDTLQQHGTDALAPEMDLAPAHTMPGLLRAISVDPLRLAEHYLKYRAMDSQGRLTLRHWHGEFWRYETGRYRLLSEVELRAELYRLLDITVSETQDDDGEPQVTPVKVRKQLVTEVIAALPSRNLIVRGESPQWLGESLAPHLELVACRNALLHLPTDSLWPHTPEYFTTAALPTAYDPNAPRPTHWLAFLHSIWPDDPASIALLQEYFGYLLTPECSHQKALFLHGPTRSGKGTLGKVLRHLFGNDQICSPTLTSLASDFGLQPLLGKTIAIIPDARLGKSTDRARAAEAILSITGEDAQLVNRKHAPALVTYLPIRFVLMSNELPAMRDNSAALASRFLMLHMTRSFYGHEDFGLEARLLRELPGILNWAVAGWRRLRARGRFVQPESGAELLQDFTDLNSPILGFIRDRCAIGAEHSVSRRELFRAWSDWAERGGYPAGNEATFGRNLRAAVPKLQDARLGPRGQRQRVLRGIAVVAYTD